MLSSPGLVLLAGLAAAVAAPTKHVHLDDVQCRCLTFSTSAAPTHCMYQELLTLDWETAHSLALANHLKMQFASEKTIAQVLSIPKPLPASVLDVVHEGKTLPLDPSKKVRSENRLICGLGNDLEYVESQSAGLKPEIHYVGTVLGVFMLLLILYLVADYVWSRSVARRRRIMLEGDEKALTADIRPLHHGRGQGLTHDRALTQAASNPAPQRNAPCSPPLKSPRATTQAPHDPLPDLWPLTLCGTWGPTHLARLNHAPPPPSIAGSFPKSA